MKQLYRYSLIIILFFLSGCSCGFSDVTGNTDNYQSYSSSVIIFADGCSDALGSTSNSQEGNPDVSPVYVPTGTCDTWDGGSYNNRGRWIKVPGNAASVRNGDSYSVNVVGAVNYCSYGYDNKNPSPTALVRPAYPRQTWFNYDPEMYPSDLPEDTQLPVQEGQLIVLDISQSSTTLGIGLGEDSTNIQTICDGNGSNDYNSFINETCRATKGFALTVYVDDTEVVTLDNTNQAPDGTFPYDSPENPYVAKTSRFPNLFSPLVMQDPNTDDDEWDSFDAWVYNKYGSYVVGNGTSKYVFKVPKGINGVLGFSIAREAGVIDGVPGSGDEYYTILARSAHPACLIENSVVSDAGSRGAVQILITPTGYNPNDEDTTTEFDPNSTTTIATYYPELIQFIASKSGGITIESDASALGDLVVYSEYEQNLIVMTSEEHNDRATMSGDIWLKVRDDYYHDNVGQYQVDVEVTTKKQTLVSEFLADITDPIVESLDNTTKIIYDSFAADSRWRDIMQMSLWIYIIMYGAGFITGLTQTSANDMVIRVVKMGAIIALFDTNSWEFFNNYFFRLFTDGKDFLITAVTGDTSGDKSGVFGFVDDMFYVFFAEITWQTFAALTPYLVGLVYVGIFLTVMILYIVAMAQVFIVYLLTLIGIALLLSLAPMFMVLMLFERTREMFLNWIKYLADYAIQPVILFATLYVLNEVFMTLWNNALNINIEYGGVWQLDFLGIDYWTFGVIKSFKFGCVQWYRVKDNDFDAFGLFVNILMLYIFTYTVKSTLSHIPKLTGKLMGASTAASTSAAAGSIMRDAVNFAQGGDPIKKKQKRENLQSRARKEEKFSEDRKEKSGNKKDSNKTDETKSSNKNTTTSKKP